jgi:hypothetical protein
MTPQELLEHQVDRFNASARAGDFGSYSEMFTGDGVLKLLGGDQDAEDTRYRGRPEIADACARLFTDRGMRIVTVISAKPVSATVDYAWASAPKEIAGQMIVKWSDEKISCLTITL